MTPCAFSCNLSKRNFLAISVNSCFIFCSFACKVNKCMEIFRWSTFCYLHLLNINESQRKSSTKPSLLIHFSVRYKWIHFLVLLPWLPIDHCMYIAVADPGFPVRGHQSRRGRRWLPRRLRFKIFVCQNERIWTIRGGVRRARPLDPSMHWLYVLTLREDFWGVVFVLRFPRFLVS